MKLNFYLTSFIVCFLSLNSFGQKQNVYFLKDNGRYVDNRDSADFTRIVREPDSGTVLYNIIEYYPNGNVKRLGKSSTINPIKLEGQCVSFYLNKNKKQIAAYKNGLVLGTVYDYYPNGKLYRSIEYWDDQKRNQERRHIGPEEIVHTVYDSTGVEIVKDNKGYYQVYDADFKAVEEEGEIIDGKRNGIWKGILNKSKITYIEEYADGDFIKGTCTDANGNTKNYTIKEALPSFRGGERAFGQYLSQNIHYPVSALQNNIQGKVILTFVIDKNGSVKNIKILSHVNYDIDAEAYRVISQSPKWNPGLQHGMPVNVAYTMPINFSLPGR